MKKGLKATFCLIGIVTIIIAAAIGSVDKNSRYTTDPTMGPPTALPSH